jgi:glucose/mannose-6-phosphate isomerase
MEEAILNFGKQFDYVPEIVNREKIKSFKRVIVLGMGGSHLPADVLKNINPQADIWVHKDYGLPDVSDETLQESLVVASSYSGNTEEVLEGLQTALKQGLNCAVVSVGGKLLDMAKSSDLAYVALPNTGIQPRSALGFSVVALATLLQDNISLAELESLKGKIIPEYLREEGKKLAESLNNFVPIIYASRKNFAVAYNWKIKFNETGKIPAFFNLLPELNHNEMTGFDINPQNKNLSQNFKVIFLKDSSDHPQIQKRMDVTKKLYEDRGIPTISFDLRGGSNAEKIFNSLVLADWAAFYTAESNGSESEQVPMVEEFKKLIF